ncbi:MAG TPA: WD40 repeat domain-containing protein [Ktedonobacterales bacterium]|nr:WD40 repeat domain-containing protein [Ktedonobacterales bacterium]
MSMTDQGQRTPDPQSEAAARERRLAALRELARQRLAEDNRQSESVWTATSAPSVSDAGRAPSDALSPLANHKPVARFAGWLWAGIATLCVLAVVVGAIHFDPALAQRLASGRSTRPSVTMQTFTPSAGDITCLTDAAWSPDGSQIALFGYQGECPQFDFTQTASSGAINVYNVVKGKQTARWLPDTLITKVAPPSTASGQTGQSIVYGSISWAANGQYLALPFAIVSIFPLNFGSPTEITQIGLLLINLSGGQDRVFLHPYQAPANLDANSALVAGGFEWDVTTGTVIAHNLGLPGAVAYRWGAHGQLIPLAKAPSAAIGNPVGGQTFTIWQPGEAQVGLELPNYSQQVRLTPIPGLYLWLSTFGVWSPDGRYLYAPAIVLDNQALPGTAAPDSAQLQKGGYGTLSTISPHDQVLAELYPHLLQQISGETQQGLTANPATDIAWSPDGRLLASQTDFPVQSSDPFTLTLYNCATGKVSMRLTHDTKLTPSSDDVLSLLRWSPDGKHLALADNAFNTMTIWTFNKSLT